jgi:hypothetical protein
MPPRLSRQEIDASALGSTQALAFVAQAEAAGRQALATGSRLCAACRSQLVASELCPQHTMGREPERGGGWAAGNRVWCEFVHGKWPARQQAPTAPTTWPSLEESSGNQVADEHKSDDGALREGAWPIDHGRG